MHARTSTAHSFAARPPTRATQLLQSHDSSSGQISKIVGYKPGGLASTPDGLEMLASTLFDLIGIRRERADAYAGNA